MTRPKCEAFLLQISPFNVYSTLFNSFLRSRAAECFSIIQQQKWISRYEGIFALLRMVSSGLLRRVALVRTDISEEFLRSVHRLLVAACVVPSSPIFGHPDGGARFLRNVGSYRATRRNNPEDTILHSHRRENLKSYFALLFWLHYSAKKVLHYKFIISNFSSVGFRQKISDG
jgi:hypothetical protein